MIYTLRALILYIVVVVFYACGNKAGKNTLIPIESFIFKSEKSHFRLSPDGSKIAYLGIHDHCKNIFIHNINHPDSSKQLTYQADFNVQGFYWINDDVILFSNTQSPQDSLRIFTVSVQSESIDRLIDPTMRRLKLVYPVREYNGAVYASMNDRDTSSFDLYRFYLDGRPKELVYQNPGNIVGFVPSNDGVIRVALTSDSAQESILYRSNENENFREVIHNDFKTMIRPLGYVSRSTTNIYALSNEGRDKLALVEYDLQAAKEIKVIHQNNKVDINKEGYVSRVNDLVFSSTSETKKEYRFFHAGMESIHKKIQEKFKGYSIDYYDMDSALNNFIIQVYSDIHPGEIYHYNAVKNEYNLLSDNYPELKEDYLLPMEVVSFNSRDNKTIQAFITYPDGKRKDCPVVVLVHDGPNGRDEWGFDPEVQFLANRGYAVFQINYRGSIGFGKDFWSAGFKEWGGRVQSDITDGVTWLIHQGIADKQRIAIMGAGFGGYAALHAACFNPSLYRCAISTSGYANLFTYFREIPPYLKPYVQMSYQIIGNPETETNLFKTISPVFHADRVRMPILYFQGGKDRFSSVTDANQFVSKLKKNNVPVQYIFKEDEGKRFRKEENIMQYYQEIENFLSKYLN